MGNALVDILAVSKNDGLLEKYRFPKGSMQLVDEETANSVYEELKPFNPSTVAGGSAANATVGISRLGLKTGFFGKIGNDELGNFYENDLECSGVKSLLMRENKGTGRSIVIITPDSERTFATYLGAAMGLTPDDISPSLFDGYDCVHIEGYLIQDHNLIETAMKLAKQEGKTVSLDLASFNVVEDNLDFLVKIVKNYADIVFANEEEAKSFTKCEPEKALHVIAEMCDIAVVKIGAKGSMVKQNGKYFHIPAVAAQPVDLTGAGDLFAAGFLYGLSVEKDIETCAKIGSICASEIIKIVGTKLSPQAWENICKTVIEI